MLQYPKIIYYQGALKAFTSLLPLLKFFSKNWFYFFFSSSDKHQSHHLVGCNAINTSLISFINALHCLSLLCLV